MICECGCGAEVIPTPRGRNQVYATAKCRRRAYQRRRDASPTPERIAGRKAAYAKYNAKRKKAQLARRRNREACQRYRDSIKALPKVRA